MSELLLNMLTLLGFSAGRVQETRDNGPDAISLTELKNKFAELKNAAASVKKIPDLEKRAARLIQVQGELEAAKKRESELILRLGQLARAGAKAKSAQAEINPYVLTELELRNAIVEARIKRGMPYDQAWAATRNKSIEQLRLDMMVENLTASNGGNFTAAWTAVHNSPEGKLLLAKIRAK